MSGDWGPGRAGFVGGGVISFWPVLRLSPTNRLARLAMPDQEQVNVMSQRRCGRRRHAQWCSAGRSVACPIPGLAISQPVFMFGCCQSMHAVPTHRPGPRSESRRIVGFSRAISASRETKKRFHWLWKGSISIFAQRASREEQPTRRGQNRA